MTRRLALVATSAVFATALVGAEGGGCKTNTLNSRTDSPDMTGDWDITYDDTFAVKITLGGATFDEVLGAEGGTVDLMHNGMPFRFNVDCSRPEVVCPSEVWPETVSAEHRNPNFPHRFHMSVPTQECMGELVAAEDAECGADTNNPDCEDVCTGEVATRRGEAFGLTSENGDAFELLLGGGVATNGINCALLGISIASADLVNEGSAETEDWDAREMENGEVRTAYAGGCLWAGDPDMDGQLEALVLGAKVEIATGFEGVKR